jgi:hypothetical protein
MKTGWLLTFAGLVISFATSSFAQQNDAIDPQIAQQIRALTMKYEEALNEHDAEAAAACLFGIRSFLCLVCCGSPAGWTKGNATHPLRIFVRSPSN